ncbi:integrase core domain-containing protein [Streptomyces sp. NPDC058228]|uniref:integrase core domain-containing protein n=1 Tax=Streptomyces sp. NPDC058228 TaxID=3346390 RepID=UPI0036EF669C
MRCTLTRWDGACPASSMARYHCSRCSGASLSMRCFPTNEAHARHVLAAYERHYNEHRPHRARNQLPPGADQQPITVHDLEVRRLLRTRILGGAINEYRYAA